MTVYFDQNISQTSTDFNYLEPNDESGANVDASVCIMFCKHTV